MNTIEPHLWEWRRLASIRNPVPIEDCPAELIHYVEEVNRISQPQHAAVPRPACASREFVQDLRSAFDELPAAVLALVPAGLLGIYLARGLGCSALVDVIRHDDEILGAALVINVDVFETRRANAWATWKACEPFSLADPPALSVTIAGPAEDHRKAALQFNLLHEIGHLMVWGRRFLPEWWIAPAQLGPRGSYAFLDLAWDVTAELSIVPRCANVGAMRDRIQFYADAQLPASAALELCTRLQRTDFPTLYATANPYEDFSECLAIYAHTRLMDRPYRLELRTSSETVLVDDQACVTARCADKLSFIASLLAA